MEYKDIDLKYTWDLSLIYKNHNDFYNDLSKAKQLMTQLRDSKDIFLTDIENFVQFHNDYTLLSRYLSKLHCFAHLNTDTMPSVQDYQSMYASVGALLDEISSSLDFYNVMMIDHSDIVKGYLDDKRVKKYKYHIECLLREKDHTLSKEEETLISKTYALSDLSEKVFDSLRLEYEPVIINGMEHELNSATLAEFLKNKNANIRMQAYHNFFKEYKKFENTFAATLSGVMKKDAFYADIRKFETPLHQSLFADHVPVQLFEKILDKANHQYISYFHSYNELKKEILGLDTLYNYDLNIPLCKTTHHTYTIDECFDIILEVTSIFGKEYTDVIRLAKEERWIDFYPYKGKRSGAYSSGCYDCRPYILMNFIGDYNSLSTMIHELGHSVHTYFSTKYQDDANSDYKIFVAEVASTVNETLLINYMLTHASSDEEKAYFLYELLESCVGLIYRQPMFAKFEHILHTYAKENKPMSAKIITDLYTDINRDYYGDKITLDEYVGYSCFHIPHFYYNYYVYKYTLGMTCALAIVSRLLKGDEVQKEAYLNFLKSGGSKDPVDLLKDAHIDPLDDELYDEAYAYFKDILEQFKSLMKRV